MINYLPSEDEKRVLRSFLGEKTQEEEYFLKWNSLCECEKWMVEIMDVDRAKDKLHMIKFIKEFASLVNNLEDGEWLFHNRRIVFVLKPVTCEWLVFSLPIFKMFLLHQMEMQFIWHSKNYLNLLDFASCLVSFCILVTASILPAKAAMRK